jgi:hypothetical protein
MEKQQDYILVSAPNKIGEAFIRQLIIHRLPFIAIANHKGEQARLEELGVNHFILVDTSDEKTWTIPEFSVGKVFLFESSLNLSCRYIRICKSWTSEPIYVITRSYNPRLIYKGLGASYVIYTNNDEVSFLIHSLVG